MSVAGVPSPRPVTWESADTSTQLGKERRSKSTEQRKKKKKKSLVYLRVGGAAKLQEKERVWGKLIALQPGCDPIC